MNKLILIHFSICVFFTSCYLGKPNLQLNTKGKDVLALNDIRNISTAMCDMAIEGETKYILLEKEEYEALHESEKFKLDECLVLKEMFLDTSNQAESIKKYGVDGALVVKLVLKNYADGSSLFIRTNNSFFCPTGMPTYKYALNKLGSLYYIGEKELTPWNVIPD